MQTARLLQFLSAAAMAVGVSTTDATFFKTTAKKQPCVSLQLKGQNGTPQSQIQDGKIFTAVVKLDESYAQNPPDEVEISAPGIQFGRTKFKFNKHDKSSFEQVVTCRTESGSAPSKDGSVVSVPVTLSYKQGPVGLASETQQIQRQVISSGRCQGQGDPHLTTLDGVAYDFQKQGVFKYFESNNFQIQIFQEKCGPVDRLKDAAPSCYQGVAVAFGASVARFFIVDGKIQLGKGSASLQWLSVEKLGSDKADGYRVFTNVDQATFVDINLNKWGDFKDYPYLNVALQVSPYFKNSGVAGLMGNWNGNKQDDETNNDKLAALFGQSLTSNLFTCVGDACSPLLKASSLEDSNAASLPTNQPLLHQGYVVVAADAIPLKPFTPVVKKFSRRRLDDFVAGQVEPEAEALAQSDSDVNGNATAPATVDSTTQQPQTETEQPVAVAAAAAVDVTARATQLCNQVISSVATCAKYVRNTDFFISSVCVGDAVLLSDLSVVDSTKLAYLRECRRELDSRLESDLASKAETATLVSDRLSLLFGDLSRCKNDCSGRGECLAAGCKCDAGFTGHGCDVAI